MKPEEKKALGRLIRKSRQLRNWTQQRLSDKSGVNLRAIQRAEGGFGIGSENLAPLAEAFGVDEGELRRKAVTSGPPPPDKRISLKLVRNGRELINVMERCFRSGWTLEAGPLDEHSYNAMVGEDIMVLAEDLEKPPRSENERVERVRHAQGIITLSQQLGFRLFAGAYTEDFAAEKRQQRRKSTLIIAAPVRDPRIIRTSKGPMLDVVRDSRRLLLGAALSGHATTYDWLEDQLMSKSDGEFRVKDEFRRIMSEVMAEMNQAEEQEKKEKQ
jgi:transcriptional regulator with XRE-family HTH domain